MLGWFRWLGDQHPPLSNTTREEHLRCLRRLLEDLALQGLPSRPDSLFARIFRFVPSISPGPYRRKMINDSKQNCAAPITSMRMLSF